MNYSSLRNCKRSLSGPLCDFVSRPGWEPLPEGWLRVISRSTNKAPCISRFSAHDLHDMAKALRIYESCVDTCNLLELLSYFSLIWLVGLLRKS